MNGNGILIGNEFKSLIFINTYIVYMIYDGLINNNDVVEDEWSAVMDGRSRGRV